MMIAVCDNNAAAAEQLAEWIRQYCRLYGLAAEVRCFFSSESFAPWMGHCEIVYIAFGGDSGFLLARLLRERDRNCRIILVDDTTAYAVRSVRIHCTDFLCKPVEFRHVVRSMHLAVGGRL